MLQLDWFNDADRMFFLFAYMLPLAVVIFGIALVAEYNLEMKKQKKRKK